LVLYEISVELLTISLNHFCVLYSLIVVHLKYSQTSVLALEESALDSDQVENLIKFCPTKEEMELLKVGRLNYG